MHLICSEVGNWVCRQCLNLNWIVFELEVRDKCPEASVPRIAVCVATRAVVIPYQLVALDFQFLCSYSQSLILSPQHEYYQALTLGTTQGV